MSDEQQDRVREIYFALLDLDTPHERAEFIEKECGDDVALQSAVAKMLEAHEANGSFLERPFDRLLDERASKIPGNSEVPGILNPTIDMPPAAEQPGSKIGPYKLLQQIGEGGFGIVYMAQQTQPVRRKVALKIIKAGMDTKEVIARFEAERQALALMDHPNIAKVLDAGTTGNRDQESGVRNQENTANDSLTPDSRLLTPAARPYFVMELVHGVPMTQFCDDNKLTTQERLELFVAVCRAVQHAHQKGIIHRDLKPSNILISMNDDKPMPKVIDFGISKALSQQLTEKTLFTAYGQMVGTPLYMSPEQAQFNVNDVDTRSDVYSLGVLLYELLTGHTPFDRETLQKSGFDEMRRMIREVDPPRPSARISTLHADALSTVSDKRKSDPRKISRSLRGELDWIVMKALEKDRNRRYESASAFAADVERYLADEPVQARPASLGYQLQKIWRKQRAVLTTTAVVVMALLTGTGVAWWQATEANAAYDSERTARLDADEQRGKAEANFQRANEQFQQAERARKQAQKNLQFAIDAAEQMYSRLARDWIADDRMASETQERFLRMALNFYRRLVDNPREYNLSKAKTAELYDRIAAIEGELRHPQNALAANLKAVTMQRELFKQKPEDIERRIMMIDALLELGARYAIQKRPGEALKFLRESEQIATATRTRIRIKALTLRYQRALLKQKTARALLSLNQSKELGRIEKLARESRAELESLDKEVRGFLARSDIITNFTRTIYILSEVARRRGDYTEAHRIAVDRLDKIEFVLDTKGDSRGYREAQGILNSQLAVIALSQNDLPEAERRLRRQLQIIGLRFATKRDPYTFVADALYAHDPSTADKEQPELWHTWVTVNRRLVEVLRKQGNIREAEIRMGRILATAGYLRWRFPQVLTYRIDAANTNAEAGLLLAKRRPKEAGHFLLEAANTWHVALKDFPDADEYKSGFHDERPDFSWFQATFPDYDFLNPALAKKVIKKRRGGQTVLGSRVMGLAAFRHKEWQTVARSFQYVIDRRNGSEAYDRFYLVIGLAKTGRYHKAREWFAKAIEWMKQNTGDDAELLRLKSEVERLLANSPVEAPKPRSGSR